MANIKNLFNTAARSTAEFYSITDPDPGGTYGKGGIFYPSDEYPEGPPQEKSVGGKILDAVKKAAQTFSGKGDGYANRMAAYNNYLNTLKYMKSAGQFSIKRGRVSTAPVTSGTGVGRGIKTTAFENQLDKWNARFRKFAVSKYYESLTRGR